VAQSIQAAVFIIGTGITRHYSDGSVYNLDFYPAEVELLSIVGIFVSVIILLFGVYLDWKKGEERYILWLKAFAGAPEKPRILAAYQPAQGFCPNCGQALTGGMYCRTCGTKLF
jgi:hypothetical protein